MRFSELIDTLWNVNKELFLDLCRHHLELIDTLWNVNIPDECRQSGIDSELIDTLWNVNVSTHNAVEPLATN